MPLQQSPALQLMREKDLTISALADIYGDFLTEKQLTFLRDYYDFDYSLSEIAEKHGVARQTVKDAIDSAVRALREFEGRLELFSRFKEIDVLADELLELAENEEQRRLIVRIKKCIDLSAR